jgi:hypothetical protein
MHPESGEIGKERGEEAPRFMHEERKGDPQEEIVHGEQPVMPAIDKPEDGGNHEERTNQPVLGVQGLKQVPETEERNRKRERKK